MCYKEFVENRLESDKNIDDPIKCHKLSLFTVTVKEKSKTETVELNQNILNKLLAYSAKTTKTN